MSAKTGDNIQNIFTKLAYNLPGISTVSGENIKDNNTTKLVKQPS